MKLQFRKLLSTILIAQILLLNVAPIVLAEEVTPTETPTTNSTDSAPADTTPTPTTEPAPQDTTPTPTVEVTPTAEVTPTQTEQPTDVSPTPTQNTTIESNTNNDDEETEEQERAKLEERRARARAAAEAYLATLPKEEGDINRTESATSALQAGINLNGGVGDSTIQTGDDTVSSAVITTANNNLAGSAGIVDEPTGAQVTTEGNGAFSDNSGALTINNDSATVQENNANVNTTLNQSATTGSNNNSKNVGGNSTIQTGDANTSGTVITAVNTNADGIMVSEFNITDDQIGDVILDFGQGCVVGCAGGSTNVANTGNGAFSDNEASVNETNNNLTFQNNDAVIGNELILNADSGNNSANDNTGGDSNIATGDANVSANLLTFANNNIAGDVIYAVVNIFGDLIGDILLPESAINNCCGTSDLSATNTGNGSLTDNDANINIDNNDTLDQTNLADINNNLILDAQTGNNSASNNTGGNSTLTTGNTDVNASLLNVVNNNLAGGNMWLVLVNEAGNWVGKLLGAPDGSHMAGSQGTEFRVDSNGQIYATNNGNGIGSDNNANATQTNNNTTVQTNNAVINNTLDLSANTGGNTTNRNTGGNSNITTGDATIVANLVNFVNNNIVGKGKLAVTVVNVFGSWLGDFVAPGQHKQNKPTELAQNTNVPDTTGSAPTGTPANITPIPPTPTPTTTASTGFVAGVSQSIQNTVSTLLQPQTNTTGNTGTTNNNRAGVTIKVAGINTANSGSATNTNAKTKSIKINLAWLILIIPVVAGLIAKKYLTGKYLIKFGKK